MKDLRSLILTRKPGVDDTAINEAERALGATFPEQYKELAKLVNNAEVGEWIFYPIKDPKNLSKTWDDIVRNNRDRRVRRISLPQELIEFADNGTGDKLCFKAVGDTMEDTVFLWDHETRKAEQIASSLEELIYKLAVENQS